MLVAPRLTKLLGLAVVLLATALVFGQDALDFIKPRKPRGAPKADFTITLTRADAKPGAEVTLTVQAEIPDGFHIFSTTQKPLGGQPTEFKLTTNGLAAVETWFTPDKQPEISPGVTAEDPDLEEYREKVTWTRKYRLKPDAVPAEVRVEGEIKYGICTNTTADSVEGACYPGKHAFEVALSDAKPAREPPKPAPVRAAPVEVAPDVAPPRAAPEEQDPPPPAPAAQVDDQASPPGIAADVPAKVAAYEHKSKTNTLVTWKASVTPKQAKPGEMVTLTLEAEILKDWHLYSANQQQPGGMGPQPMKVQFNLGKLEDKSWFNGPEPHQGTPEAEDWVKAGVVELYHEGKVRWVKTFQVPKDAKAGDVPIEGAVSYQVCSASCVSHAVRFDGELTIRNSTVAEPAYLAGTKLSMAEADELITNPNEVRDGAAPKAAAPANKEAAVDLKKQGLFMFMVTAVGFGFVALLTPCVFPMVPITVSVFHKQAEKQHTNPVLMAAVYALSIIFTFTVLGVAISAIFGAAALTTLANNAWLNLGIAVILVFFACNMLGMYDIVMPSWVLNLTAGGQARGGYLGVIFMGLTFTLTSFTCTFAFAGALITMAAAGDWVWPALGMLGFSTAFALPFFLLALFPSMLSKLPRSGGWMNTIKVVMGMLELGAVFKFLSVADVTWNGRPMLFDFELVVSAWMILAAVTGIYLLGQFRTPHDMPVESISVPRLIMAMSFLGVAAYIGVNLIVGDAAKNRQGVVWTNIVAFAPPRIGEAVVDKDLGPTLVEDGHTYALDPDKALAHAVKLKKPLFIDFTGVNCQNCRLMEQGPLSTAPVHDRLKNFVLVRVYADRVPGIETFEESKRILKRNQELQTQWFGDQTLPAYAVVSPTPDAYANKDTILSSFIGFKNDASLFTQFLDNGLQRVDGAIAARVQDVPRVVQAVAAGR